jgi:hypothetical protein
LSLVLTRLCLDFIMTPSPSQPVNVIFLIDIPFDLLSAGQSVRIGLNHVHEQSKLD